VIVGTDQMRHDLMPPEIEIDPARRLAARAAAEESGIKGTGSL
jgi:hypothetical protein